MVDYTVVKYSNQNYNEWNDFLLQAKNATFLFHRDFMEYHQDRFEDYSLLIYNKNKLIAILPANKIDDVVYSHKGLTYGGLVLANKSTFQSAKESIFVILKYLSGRGIETLYLKQLPKIYHLKPSDEFDYLAFILNVEVYRKDVSMCIELNNGVEFSTLRKRQIKLATKNNLHVKLETDMSSFWNELLIPNLKTKHRTVPTHSLNDITTLREKFPNNIKQFNVYQDEELLAGCTVFETETVAHLQYISTKKVKSVGALDYLINYLMSDYYKEKKYFDFGISNENEGRSINEGLLNWKQSFGASAIVHDFYKIETKNYSLLKNIMI